VANVLFYLTATFLLTLYHHRDNCVHSITVVKHSETGSHFDKPNMPLV